MNLYEILKKLDIAYDEIEHEAVYTVLEAKQIKNMIDGVGCKNLFIKDKSNNYYVYILPEDKKANFKELSRYLKTSGLTFASEEELFNILKLSKGSVTPLGIINDNLHITKILVDSFLIDKKLLFHPNINTKTISIFCSDLFKFINFIENEYFIV